MPLPQDINPTIIIPLDRPNYFLNPLNVNIENIPIPMMENFESECAEFLFFNPAKLPKK